MAKNKLHTVVYVILFSADLTNKKDAGACPIDLLQDFSTFLISTSSMPWTQSPFSLSHTDKTLLRKFPILILAICRSNVTAQVVQQYNIYIMSSTGLNEHLSITVYYRLLCTLSLSLTSLGKASINPTTNKITSRTMKSFICNIQFLPRAILYN